MVDDKREKNDMNHRFFVSQKSTKKFTGKAE